MIDNNECLETMPFWEKLSEAEKDSIRRSVVSVKYKKGQNIHGGINDCLGMLMVKKGCVRVYILSEEGREITLYRIPAGDCCVISASCVIRQITFETQMVAEEETELLVLGSGVFGPLTENNIYVRCSVFELLTKRFSDVMWTMQEILFKGFDRRLASFLIREYDRTGSKELRMTHEQLAQNTSSAREVVARMLKRFVADGLVSIKRGSIQLLDIDALRDLSK